MLNITHAGIDFKFKNVESSHKIWNLTLHILCCAVFELKVFSADWISSVMNDDNVVPSSFAYTRAITGNAVNSMLNVIRASFFLYFNVKDFTVKKYVLSQ